MGPLFQLIFAIIAYSILASIVGLFLYVVIRTAAYIWNGNSDAAKQGFWLPLKLGPYFFLALIGTIIVCEVVRDVTPPLTDYWSFQLGQETSMGAIDTLDNWTIWPSPDVGEGIVSNVALFGVDRKAVYGITKENDFFIYWLEPVKDLVKLSELDFETELTENGWSRANMKTPTDYYYDNRSFGDLITLLIILIYPFFRLYKLARLFFNKVSTNNKEMSNQIT